MGCAGTHTAGDKGWDAGGRTEGLRLRDENDITYVAGGQHILAFLALKEK